MTEPYPERLRSARRDAFEALTGAELPTGRRDQLATAERDIRQYVDSMGLGPLLASGNHPDEPEAHRREVLARSLAFLPRLEVCPHLERVSAQACVARLDTGRLDCLRCVGSGQPPAPPPGRCGWCEAEGRMLDPLMYLCDTALVLGDACSDCADAIRFGGNSRTR